MGKKNRKNKTDQRQVSQPPTDTSEATQEQSESMNDADLLSDVGTSVCSSLYDFIDCFESYF